MIFLKKKNGKGKDVNLDKCYSGKWNPTLQIKTQIIKNFNFWEQRKKYQNFSRKLTGCVDCIMKKENKTKKKT